MKKEKFTLKDLTLCALFAALMAICAWISIPVLEIAFTLQTFAVFLTLGLLGGKRGTISVLVYIVLGAVGVPVFAGFRGGPGVLLGVTGGYIAGFLFSALLYWLITALMHETPVSQLLGMIAGMLACYLFGSLWFMWVYASKGTAMGLAAIVRKCVVPYLIPDAAKIALAYFLTRRLAAVRKKALSE